MLNKLLPNTLDCIILNKVRRFDAASLSFDGLSWSVVLLRNLISNADDCAVGRVFVEVFIEILESSVCGLWIQEIYHRDEHEVEDGEHWTC